MLDRQMLVSQAQSITTGTIVSTDVIDLSQARDIGAGGPLDAFAQVVTAFATLTSVDFQLIVSATSNLASPTVIAASGAVPVAQLTLGNVIELGVGSFRASVNLGQRWLGIQYVVVGTGTGAVTAGIGTFSQASRARAKAYPAQQNIA